MSHSSTLSQFTPSVQHFEGIDKVIASFRDKSFLALSLRKRFKKINQTLCKLIQGAPLHSYLLGAVLDFLVRIEQEKILPDPIHLATFEFWINNFSELSDQENYELRAKIAGKSIPRGEYQAYFPIGMDRIYTGTHFVTAHLSPDIDTMIASFWGWLDAFAARVGTGLHLWALPGGPPDSPVTTIFRDMHGPGLFNFVARTPQTLTLTAMDLVTQKKLTKELGSRMTGDIDHSSDAAIILVSDQGHYLGDWHHSDVEIVRQIIVLFKSCLRWFENNLHTQLISLFAKNDLSSSDCTQFNKAVFDVKIRECEPALEFNENQKSSLNDFFHKILGVEKGLDGTFGDLNKALEKLSVPEMARFQEEVEKLPSSAVFDKKGHLKEERPLIFHLLEKMINHLDEAIHSVRNYVERLDVVIGIKHIVLGLPLEYITLRTDVEEMRQKMQNFDFLTVVIHERDGSLFPVGIVRANDLRMNVLGTVSFRDFCNQEEVKMASYLEVISVVDHHKSSLKTLSVPSAIIGDAQSCNVLLAEVAFQINDKYGLGEMTKEQIDKQIKALVSDHSTPSQTRLLRRLLKRRMASHTEDQFYIDPKREFDEYLSFLQAILDDTDLLTKVSNRDVLCVAELLNRLKSLSLKQEVEIIHFDDISQDKNFAKKAAKKILQQADMYSLYKKVYSFREADVETNLKACLEHKPSTVFIDTKEQNGCARVGQTKLFASNFPFFLEHADEIRWIWQEKAKEVNTHHREIDFHLHMISTISSAEEVYQNQIGGYPHLDELWFWVPATQQGFDHLSSFLAGFQYSLKNFKETLSVEFVGDHSREYQQIFSQYFPDVPVQAGKHANAKLSMAILRFKAGSLNSRKSMITPYLPK